MYKYILTEEAREDLKRLEPGVRKRIFRKLDFYVSQKNIFDFAKALRGFLVKKYRFRVGNYRIIFTIEPDGTLVLLVVLAIGHRKDVYFE